MALDATGLSNRLAALPLVAAVNAERDREIATFAVGGVVRDLLLGRPALDLDIAVEGDPAPLAGRLARRIGGEVVAHGRFGTAAVVGPDEQAIDLAQTRRETYATPGALPIVEPATLTEDLVRRDFTVNAMAIELGNAQASLLDPHGGVGDLERRELRVLHDASFEDDPTRLLRATRYGSRLGFVLETHTADLARRALDNGALGTVSGARIATELLLLLGQDGVAQSVDRLERWGIAAALEPKLRLGPEVGAAVGAAPVVGATAELAGLAALCLADAPETHAFVEGLGLPGGDRDRVLAAAARAPKLVEGLAGIGGDGALYDLLNGEAAETLAVALALGAPPQPIERYVGVLSATELEIDGNDLIAAGAAQSLALGAALRETLRRKVDGELHGRDAELAAALAVVRERER